MDRAEKEVDELRFAACGASKSFTMINHPDPESLPGGAFFVSGNMVMKDEDTIGRE